MTPKEKAIELYNKFLNPSGDTYLYGMLEHESAKECAIIAVYEILESLGYKSLSDSPYTTLEARQYYVQVKQEIEKL